MSKTKITCPDCGSYYDDYRGLGDKEPKLICSNRDCPGHFKKHLCPKCHSNEKSNIKRIGLGHEIFVCKSCKHEWSTL